MAKKVIVIGAGIGGLSAAARLLSKGYEVGIIEKERTIGGKVNLLEEEGFRFDLTASILMMPEDYIEVFSYAGRDYRDYFEFMELDPIYRANYPDDSSIDFSSSIGKLTKSLESISKENSRGYYKFIGDAYAKYLMADRYFLNKAFRKPGDFFNLPLMAKALKLKTLSTSYNFISKFVEDERLRRFLSYQALYVGISPFDGPNVFTLVPVVSQLYGLNYIKGGMYSYVEALGKLIHDLGGRVETQNEVKGIRISGGRVIGVETQRGNEYGDIVVCNADFPYAVKELIKEKGYRGKFRDRKIDNMKYSCSNFILYLGLKNKFPELSVHNLYLNDDFKENIQCVFTGCLPEKPSLYLYCPSRIDESMAGRGRECLTIVARVPNLFFDKIKWNRDTALLMRRRVLEELKRIKGLEDIEKDIVYENFLTPEDLKTCFNSYGGTAYGLSHTLTQTNYFRPHLKSSEVEGLYFTGSSVHPGAGVSIVLKSGKLVVNEILRDENRG